MKGRAQSVDMTQGSIVRGLVCFAIPLLLGNLFQSLYNTADTLIVGNCVGKEALAAVGASGPLINMLVLFFQGVSVGAGVVISRSFGAHDHQELHKAVETTVSMTLILAALFTLVGSLGAPQMLLWMATPEEVMKPAVAYLRIYFLGISGLLIYNMGSGILRAVGDSRRPLRFLMLSSALNIVLDLVMVLIFRLGIAGVAIATVLSQGISAVLILRLLTTVDEPYRLSLSELAIDRRLMRDILNVGLPTGLQSMLTQFSNAFAQSYINRLGADCMAGWSSFSKLDQFAYLPINNMGQATTTFVSQNLGGGQRERARKGTRQALLLCVMVSVCCSAVLFAFARPLIGLFSREPGVVEHGVLFLRVFNCFRICSCVINILSGAMRGRHDAKAPMLIMLSCMVVFRQLYLAVITRFANTALAVASAWPVAWVLCSVLEATYYYMKHVRKEA